MEKQCLIIMPASELQGYADGHFGRVFEYVIAPACKLAGFTPTKLDIGGEQPLDVLKTLIESDVVLCDLSSNSRDITYGFILRQVLSLPVVLIKDSKTVSKDIAEFDRLEYDDSLRIDTVQRAVAALGDSLKKAYDGKGDVHSLLKKMGPQKPVASPVEPEEPVQKEPSMPMISPVPDYVGESFTQQDIDKIKVGDTIFHMVHGKGEVISIKNMGKTRMVTFQFASGSSPLVIGLTGYFRKIK